MFNTDADSLAASPMVEAIALDLNFLPERYRGPRLRLSVLRPWLFLLGFALLLIPSLQLLGRNLREQAAVQTAFDTVSAELAAYQPLAEERAALEARISSADAQSNAIESAYQIINIHRVSWSDLVPRILDSIPEGLGLTLVNHSAEEVTLEGLASKYSLPSEFADNLETLPDFQAVVLRSVVQLPPEENPAIELGAEAGSSAERPTIYRFQITLYFPVVAAPEAQAATEE